MPCTRSLPLHMCPLQVKNKMSLESFRRNLRGVNENQDFPEVGGGVEDHL